MENSKPSMEPVIRGVYEKIKTNLIGCHEVAAMLENKANTIYSQPQEALRPSPENEKLREERNFHDSMCKLLDMSEHLLMRLEQTKRNLDEAI